LPAVTPFNQNRPNKSSVPATAPVNAVKRVRIIYSFLLFISAVFVIRLFYLQVIKHDYYRKAALSSQLKQYEIPAERGTIYAHDGDNETPIVLNEKKYTLFADPTYVKDPLKEASAVAIITGGDVNKLRDLLQTKGTRYVVLGKKLNKDQSDKIAKLDFNGIGTREEEYRTYPQGALAAQVLGFVNDDGEGQYGVEQYLNDKLSGQPGELKAITDAQGVPLVSNKDNIVTDPVPGEQLNLTIDIDVQRQLEQILKDGLEHAQAKSGSALIINVHTGAILAMANYPSFDPSKLQDISDLSTLSDPAISSPLEVGSIMKLLTTSAALSEGVITPTYTYYDPAKDNIDGTIISNVAQDGGPQQRSIANFLSYSLNTGAIHLLKLMGRDDNNINQKGRDIWHDYMVNHFGFGTLTGIDQPGEAKGTVPDPDHGYGLNVVYANTSFGQGMSATMLQMAAAYAAVINGGNYYQPHVVESVTNADGKTTLTKPKVLRQSITPQISDQVTGLLEGVFTTNHGVYSMPHLPEGYRIGGKTGSAQVANPSGGYYTDRFTGTFAGFVGGNQPDYVIVSRVDDPKINGNAGAASAAPIFSNLVTMLINNYGLTPKS